MSDKKFKAPKAKRGPSGDPMVHLLAVQRLRDALVPFKANPTILVGWTIYEWVALDTSLARREAQLKALILGMPKQTGRT